mgnify:CR=1 FL=1
MLNGCLEHYRSKEVLVTGGTGFLGSKFVKELYSVGSKVSLLVRKNRKIDEDWAKGLDFQIYEGDILDEILLKKALKGKEFLFHFAARDNKFGLKLKPMEDIEVNVLSILKILEVCRLNNYSPKIIFPGSENQLGVASQVPVNEDFVDNPLNIFGLNKLFAEKYLQYYKSNFGIDSVTLRLSNLYGPTVSESCSRNPSLNKIISDSTKGSVKVFTSGNFLRDFIYIDDAINAFLLAGKNIKKLDRPFYYVGSGLGSNFMETMNLISEKVEKKAGTKVELIKSKPEKELSDFDKRNFVADHKQFSEITSWTPQIFLSEGIDRTLDYFLSL